mgnify:CR=1 FL=1
MAKKEKTKNEKRTARKYEAGKIFIKVMSGLLALLMVLAVSATLIYYIINQ